MITCSFPTKHKQLRKEKTGRTQVEACGSGAAYKKKLGRVSPHSPVGSKWASVAIYLLYCHWEFPLLSHVVLCWKTGYSGFCKSTGTHISMVVIDEIALLGSPPWKRAGMRIQMSYSPMDAPLQTVCCLGLQLLTSTWKMLDIQHQVKIENKTR